VSLRCCPHIGAKLADNATCGARCASFPACLPVLPTERAREVVLALHSPADEHRTAAAARDVLDELHAAITEGLRRKVDGEQSDPRW
jgi:hypothetical protein